MLRLLDLREKGRGRSRAGRCRGRPKWPAGTDAGRLAHSPPCLREEKIVCLTAHRHQRPAGGMRNECPWLATNALARYKCIPPPPPMCTASPLSAIFVLEVLDIFLKADLNSPDTYYYICTTHIRISPQSCSLQHICGGFPEAAAENTQPARRPATRNARRSSSFHRGWPRRAARVRARVRAAMGAASSAAGMGGGWAGGGRGGGGTASTRSSAGATSRSLGNGEHKSPARPARRLPIRSDISSSFSGLPAGGLPSGKHARTRGRKSDMSPVTPFRVNDRSHRRRTSVATTAVSNRSIQPARCKMPASVPARASSWSLCAVRLKDAKT